MQYNQYSQVPAQAKQGEPGKGEKGSGTKWLIQYVIVPIVVALIGAGIFFGVKSANNNNTPTIPVLHSTYTGTTNNLANGQEFNFSLVNLSEDTNTGNLTSAASVGGCAAQITNGTVDTGGHVAFKLNQEFNSILGCAQLVVDFTGQVNSAGDISGQWIEENTQFNGTFKLS